MADTKISALASKSAPTATDLAVIVDVADTSMAASGTDKQVTVGALLVAPVAVAAKTANYTLTAADALVIGDPSGGSFTLTLPSSPATGKRYTVKRSDAAAALNNTNTLTVAPASGAIDGESSILLALTNEWLGVIYDGANWQVIDRGPFARVKFRQTADGATLANSTTETSLVGAGVGSLTIPANALTPGRSYRLTAWGVLSTAASAPNLSFRVKLGSVTLGSTGATFTANSLTNTGWRVSSEFTCRAAGASGSVEAQGASHMTPSATRGAFNSMNSSGTAGGIGNASPIAVDTTAAQLVDLLATFSAANASNAITLTHLTLESLN